MIARRRPVDGDERCEDVTRGQSTGKSGLVRALDNFEFAWRGMTPSITCFIKVF